MAISCLHLCVSLCIILQTVSTCISWGEAMDEVGMIKSLVELRRANVSELSREIGYERANLVSALAGRRNLPEMMRPRLLKALGVERGRLIPTMVHFWTVGADIEHLVTVAKSLFRQELEMCGLWRAGGGLWDPKRAIDRALYAISGHGNRVVVLRSGLIATLGLAKPVNPDTIPHLHWRGGTVGAANMVKLPEGAFNKWEVGDIAPEEFDRVIRRKTKLDWDEAIMLARDAGFTPDDLAAWVISTQKRER